MLPKAPTASQIDIALLDAVSRILNSDALTDDIRKTAKAWQSQVPDSTIACTL